MIMPRLPSSLAGVLSSALLPWLVPMVAIASVWIYGVDVPVGDQWSIADFFQRHAAGMLRAADWFEQSNDSRPFFPRLVFFGLTRVGAWHPVAEMLVSQVLLLASAIGIATLWRRTQVDDRDADTGALLTAFLALYSLAQMENLYWGVQIVVYAPFVCLIGALVLAHSRRSWFVVLAGSAACCIVATYSYANGVLCWLLVPVALLCARGRGSRQVLWLWLAWAAVAIVTILLYFTNYIGGTQSVRGGSRTAFDAALAYLAYIGAGLSFGPDRFWVAVTCGATVLLALAAVIAYVVRHQMMQRASPWLILAAYTLISGVAIVDGRLGAGREYMLASRYVTFSAPVLVALVFLVSQCLADFAARQVVNGERASVDHLRTIVICVIAILSVVASVESLAPIRETATQRRQAKAVLQYVAVAPASLLEQQFYFMAPFVQPRGLDLQRAGYLPSPRDTTWVTTSTAGCIDGRRQQDDGTWMTSGWTLLPERNRPADAVLVTRGAKPEDGLVAIVVPTDRRPDLAYARRSSAIPLAGWRVQLDDPTARADLRFWAIDATARRAYRLCNAIAPLR